MATIYIKKQGETLDSLSPLVVSGNPIPPGALKGNIITSYQSNKLLYVHPMDLRTLSLYRHTRQVHPNT